jgi:hypothetical protein
MKALQLGIFATILSVALFEKQASAVPTAFLLAPSGNQRDANWKTIETPRFRIYHEDSAQSLGNLAAEATEAAWPYLSFSLGIRLPGDSNQFATHPQEEVSRFQKIPVIINARADIGGFANLATQNIEVQVQSGAKASLFQHELTHRIMYERIDPNFGPGGRIFTTAMLPTWWIEGLAEHLTESVGRWESQGIARTMALNDHWPSWDSLHNLYNAPGDYGKGYVTSGRFFTYLRSLVPQKTLAELHDSFFWKTLTPPFATATHFMLKKHWNKSGPELYQDFKDSQKAYWSRELEGMPSLTESAKTVTSRQNAPNFTAWQDTFLINNLQTKPLESSLTVLYNLKQIKERRPLDIEGSHLFALAPWERHDGGFWSTREQNFDNSTTGDELNYFEFRGDATDIKASTVARKNSFSLSNAKNPVVITDILATGKGKAFVLGSIRGDFTLYYIDSTNSTVTILKRWTAPTEIHLVKQSQEKKPNLPDCAALIIDYDLERTSLERQCHDGTGSVLLPPGKLFIRSAVEHQDDKFLLQFAWNSATGLVEFQNGVFTHPVAVPEWGDALHPCGENTTCMWTFTGDKFDLLKFSLENVFARSKAWLQTLPETSQWRTIPAWHSYQPPFIAIAEKERLLTGATRSSEKSLGQNQTAEKRETTTSNAPYKHRHFFSYPTLIPPYLGGWSVGLASIPWMDEMERDRVEIFADYSLSSNLPNGKISYVNNRVFDAFAFTMLSQSRFNGKYYARSCGTKFCDYSQYPRQHDYAFYSYLRENGIEISSSHLSKSAQNSLVLALRISNINPLYSMDNQQEISTLGTQKAVLATAGAAASTIVAERAFYSGKPTETGKGSLIWHTSLTGAAQSTHGISKAYDYSGHTLPTTNFQRYSLSGKSSISLAEKAFSLRGEIGATTGSSPLNLREYYQPFRTYLQGTGMSLNALNLSLASAGQIFTLDTGAYSFRTSMDYAFPLWRNLDYQFLILYFEGLRGELGLSHGGVARNEDFSDFHTYDTASAAVRATINIKGFQLFPTLTYAHLLGRDGWSLFSEISFSQFF